MSCSVFGQTPDLSQTGGLVLSNGGAVRGELTSSEANDGLYEVSPVQGGKVVLAQSSTSEVKEVSSDVILYHSYAPLRPDSVNSQLKIANWCVSKRLTSEAERHFQRVIELDPNNEAAHKALHHVMSDGEWVSSKDRLEQRGLVRKNGRSMSPQEAAILEARKSEEESARQWKKELTSLYSEALSGSLPSRERLQRVRDPGALATLMKLYNQEKDGAGRELLVQAIASIGDARALGQLGKIAMSDPDADVRVAAVNGIVRKPTAVSDAIGFFRRQLNAGDNPESVARAAYALKCLKAEEAIPDLINSLERGYRRQIVVGSDRTGASFDSSGKVNSFSGGGSARVNTITETLRNDAVHDALINIVAEYNTPPVDYKFDVDAWNHWRHNRDQLMNFYPRRNR
ncbi:MAG: HEAT repeat domain-containing protein [Planctomycetia bacterium]|nr:HEAT repeat domain-containing protein [Planctomycetia bacterium]